MRILRLTEKDYKTGKWSGGTTTELFIFPENANYANREFSFRISSARVDLEESDFTPLENVMRYITPLTDGFTLTHPDGSSIIMQPLDNPYRFSGEIPTHCVGKATDFNLMLKGVDGEMAICDELWQIKRGFNCLYAVEDTEISLEKGYNLAQGDLLVVFSDEEYTAFVDKKALTCFVKI